MHADQSPSLPHDRRIGVLDALFDDLPPQARDRFGLTSDATPASDGTSQDRNSAIKARKAAAPPPQVAGAPSSPWQLSRASWIAATKRVAREVGTDRVTSVSAGVTFFALLALFPAITALVSIYGLFADQQTIVEHLDALRRFMPNDAYVLIQDQVSAIVQAPSTALGFATIIGLLTALWSANGGIKALLGALNIAWFERETRGFIRLTLVSLGFTLGGMVLICVMIATTAVLPILLRTMSIEPFVETLTSLARWPLMFIILLLALAALYRWGPDKVDAKWHWISPGALFATVGLIAASILFSWYAANFADYNKTYGSLGAAVGLMMWLWIASMVVMIGAEINSEIERQIQKENGIPLEDDTAKTQS